MADFTAFRGTNPAGFPGGIGREVVVVNVAFGGGGGERVDLLFHLQHVECGHTHDLGFAAFEKGRAMGAGNQINFYPQIPDVSHAPAVDAEMLRQNHMAHNFLHDGAVGGPDFFFGVGFAQILGEFTDEAIHHLFEVSVGGVVAFLLVFDSQQVTEFFGGFAFYCLVDVIAVWWEEREFLRFFGHSVGEATLGETEEFDDGFRSFQAFGDYFFGRGGFSFGDFMNDPFGGAGLDHHNGNIIEDFLADFFLHNATGNNEFENGFLVLRVGGECHPLPFRMFLVRNQCHAHAPHRAGYWQARELGCGGCAVNGNHIVHVFRVDG